MPGPGSVPTRGLGVKSIRSLDVGRVSGNLCMLPSQSTPQPLRTLGSGLARWHSSKRTCHVNLMSLIPGIYEKKTSDTATCICNPSSVEAEVGESLASQRVYFMSSGPLRDCLKKQTNKQTNKIFFTQNLLCPGLVLNSEVGLALCPGIKGVHHYSWI